MSSSILRPSATTPLSPYHAGPESLRGHESVFRRVDADVVPQHHSRGKGADKSREHTMEARALV